MGLRIYGNRLLRTPTGAQTRPTSGRVRSAVFGRWHPYIADCRWLDLCAGAGSMGAEALARGAQAALGIEVGAEASRLAAANWEKVAPGRGTIWRSDVLAGIARLGRQGGRFDLIYFDPPYRSPLYAAVLQAIAEGGLLEAQGELAVEHAEDLADLPGAVGPLVRVDRRVYGGTAVSFYALA